MGIFADYAPKYFELGYNILPMIKGTKAFTESYQKWKTVAMSEDEFSHLMAKYHDAEGIILITGPYNGISLFDIDLKDKSLVEKYKTGGAPRARFERFGSKGSGILFRYNEQLAQKKKTIKLYEASGNDWGEIILEGLCVLPPSIHKDTRQPYKWVSHEQILDFSKEDFLDELPVFTESDLDIYVTNHNLSLKSRAEISKGRNDKLKKLAVALFYQGEGPDEVAQVLLEKDLKWHKDISLFSDKSEFDVADPFLAALQFANSIYRTIFESIASVSFTDSNKNYPNKDAGFTIKIPKKTRAVIQKLQMLKDGQTHDEKGEPIVIEEWDMMSAPCYNEIARYFKNEKQIHVSPAFLTYYDGCKFVKTDNLWIQSQVEKSTLGKYKSAVVEDMFKKIQKHAYHEFKEYTPSGLINLKNGVLDVLTEELKPHSKEHEFFYCVNYDWDQNATCPNFIKFLWEVTCEDQSLVDLIQEIFGYCIMGGPPFLHKCFIFYGEGRNGKGTLFKVLEDLVGKENTATVRLSALQEPNHAMMLKGKLINIVNELEKKAIESDVFKQAVAGEAINAKYLYKDITSLTVESRFLISCNEPPRFNESNTSIYDRLVTIPFDRYFTEDERVWNLSTKLADERPGILNWAIQGAKRLLETRALTKSSRCETLAAEIKENNDSVVMFSNNLEFSDTGTDISSANLYQRYKLFAQNIGVRPLSQHNFARRMIKLRGKTDGGSCTTPPGMFYRSSTGMVLRGVKRLADSVNGLSFLQ